MATSADGLQPAALSLAKDSAFLATKQRKISYPLQFPRPALFPKVSHQQPVISAIDNLHKARLSALFVDIPRADRRIMIALVSKPMNRLALFLRFCVRLALESPIGAFRLFRFRQVETLQTARQLSKLSPFFPPATARQTRAGGKGGLMCFFVKRAFWERLATGRKPVD